MLPNFGGMNPQKMLQKMQDDMQRVQDELDAERLETASGDNTVKVVTSGMGELLELHLSPEIVDPNDIEMLQDAVVITLRTALKKAQEHHQKKMNDVMGGLPKIPGLF
jgi:DNA-binding YbaB/EbfC family protein